MFETKRDVGIDTTTRGMREAFAEDALSRFSREEPKPNRLLAWMLSGLWLLAGGAMFAVIFWS